MATKDDSKDSRRSSIINLTEEIKKSKAKGKEVDLSKDVEELQSLIESLKKEREKNTAASKLMQRVSTKIDKASNPTTYLRAVMPKFFETFHQNLDTYDKERKARLQLEKIQTENRKKEIKELTSSLDEFVKGSQALTEVANRFGKNAARQEALVQEEIKELQKAEKEYLKNMDTISDRLKSIDDDARKEWAKQKGIQLVKIVEDEPTKEGLEKIKNELSNQIEADAQRYDKERLDAKKKATDDRRNKEAMLKEQSWFRKFWGNKKDEKKDNGGGFLSQLLGAWAIENLIPALLKAGLITGLIAGIVEYFSNEELKQKIDDLIDAIDKNIITPMFEKLKPKLELAWENFKTWLIDKMKAHWEWVLAGLALAFPRTTLALIDVALKGLITAIQWAAKKIYTAMGGTPGTGGVPDVEGPDKKPKGGNSPEKKSERSKTQPRDEKGRFKKGVKTPKGTGMRGRVGGALGILSILGMIGDTLWTSDEEYEILRDQSFSDSKAFELLTPEEQDKYLELLSDPEKNDELKKYRQSLLDKYDLEDNNTALRWKERYVKKTKPVQAPSVGRLTSTGVLDNPYNNMNPFFASQLGCGGGNSNGPTLNTVNTTNNSQTTIIPFKSAVDPSRSIMFQNKP